MTRLRLRMLDSKLPFYKIGGRAHIPATTLAQYSLGRRPVPPHHLVELAQVLGCRPADLIGDVDEPWLTWEE